MGRISLQSTFCFALLRRLACGTLLAGQLFAAQEIPAAEISHDTLAALERSVQLELERRVRAASDLPTTLPGVTAAIHLPGGKTAEFAAGQADLENGVAMQVDHRMPAGSVGKTFVAAIVMSLVADQQLQLDEPIARWLGTEDWFSRLPNHQTLTLRHLLNHSGGIIDHVFDEASDFAAWFASELEQDAVDQDFDHEKLVHFALDREPLFAAGQGFHYTDTGYILIGLVIEKATGVSYYELLAERILEPLGLTSTSPNDHRNPARVTQGYAVDSHEQLGLSTRMLTNGRLAFNPLIEWTGGGVVSNPRDLANWMAGLFERQALGSESVEQMLTSVAGQGSSRDSTGRPLGYGLGISIVHTDAGTAYRHGGFFPGYVSMAAYFPAQRTAIAMQINSDSADLEAHFNAVRDIVFNTVGMANQTQ